MKQYTNREWLEKEYTAKGPSRLAEELGINHKTINYWVNKFGISKIGCGANAKKHRVESDFFRTIDSEEKAYWLGFLMADGCVYHGDSASSLRFQINLSSRDRAHLELFNNTIKSDYDVASKTVHLSNGTAYDVCQLKVDNTQFCSYLLDQGIYIRKSGQESIPVLDQDLVQHFVRGYFDGDGCISQQFGKSPQVTIVSGRHLIDQLSSILLSIGIERFNVRCHNGAYALNFGGRQSIQAFSSFVYRNATVYLQRKRLRFMAA